MIRRNGMTVPLPGHLHAQRDKLAQLADWGYSDIWSAETDAASCQTCCQICPSRGARDFPRAYSTA